MSKQLVLQDWPTALAIREPEGWAIYGGVDSELEMSTVLARGFEYESEAWEEALEHYKSMTEESA